MQLPPFLIPKPQTPTVAPQQSQLPEFEESDQCRLIKNLNSLCGQGFWFAVGLSIAHVARIVGAPVMLVAVILLAGGLFAVKPKNPTPYLLSMRRISGLVVIVGTAVAFWDAAWLLANMPLVVGFGFRVTTVWQLGVIVGLSVVLMKLVALLRRNR
ncbi:MAG: hypothetical protein JGK03_15475 [Microcoleus sp. PH2017_25_DOB_D_A]|uniref:hypothetical protein n=1 Tax=unclassified Microcoleus TaxID=2642155 RepID=UPI001D9307B2|nr:MULTISPECIES: hypothetical protein [unclassified Microcoleus]MCC3498340.1 hypothetical protein [Microcoleus sp. PH2017_15_JOR_U_A]MCC3509523.1 hypothetical protein [Microcoleus sp. PH2017_17_BER_D_A]MCC3535573.1 hypothetical protein [Microcoleus sp. PH2017_25_DOB_D_A]MCC3545458.1 hypothetical protein [Microcoleus sp. PH2017_24_DOB_U_A]